MVTLFMRPTTDLKDRSAAGRVAATNQRKAVEVAVQNGESSGDGNGVQSFGETFSFAGDKAALVEGVARDER